MTRVDVDDEVWTRFQAVCQELGVADPVRYLEQWIRHLIRQQSATDGRYWPVACALVTKGEDEVLLVGNEYATGQPLAWNLPGGLVEPGEDLHEAVRRELAEECGLQAIRVGRLAWMVQVDYGAGKTGLLSLTFEVPEWTGDLVPEHRDREGFVRASEFVSAGEACRRVIRGNAQPLADWISAPWTAPRIYWYGTDGVLVGPRRLSGLAVGSAPTQDREGM